MNEKRTLQDIIDLLAKKHSMGRQDAEAFVKGIFKVIEEALDAERYVKVKGLGTFKLTEVEARESVNVNTGERIEIKGHTKISFVPDTTMKDLINKPFSYFETVILNENTTLEDTETEVENEEKPESTEETCAVPAENREEITEKQPDEKEFPLSEEENETVTETSDPEPVVMEESKEEIIPEPVLPEEQPIDTSQKENDNQEQGPKFPKKKWVVPIVLVLLVFLCWHYIHSNQEEPVLLSPAPAIEVTSSCEESPIPADSVVAKQEDTVKLSVPQSAPVTLADTIEYDMVGTKAQHTLQEGESLAKIAMKFYGTKNLWPYIVKYNKSVIKNADVIPVGVTLNIPELTPKQ